MDYYKKVPPTCTVNVLGTEYHIYLDVSQAFDPHLKECSGYCDKTAKRIAIVNDADSDLEYWDDYRKYCLRHELIHAFLYESGIGGDTTWDVPGEEHSEHMVEWIGMQFPKILKAFQEVGAL